VVAGDETNPSSDDTWGFRYRAGTIEYPPAPSPGIRWQTVYAVNEVGTVVGSAYFPNYGWRPMRWRRAGNPLVLGLLPGGDHGEAFDINETEFVVGLDRRFATNTGWRERAFLFHYDFGMVELPAPWNEGPWPTDCRANRLNDRKENGLVQVAGYCARNGRKQAVRWDVFVSEHAHEVQRDVLTTQESQRPLSPERPDKHVFTRRHQRQLGRRGLPRRLGDSPNKARQSAPMQSDRACHGRSAAAGCRRRDSALLTEDPGVDLERAKIILPTSWSLMDSPASTIALIGGSE
jgi:hypothetical protein